MLFSSIVFLFTFLPAVLVLYYLLPERFHNPVLLLASLISCYIKSTEIIEQNG